MKTSPSERQHEIGQSRWFIFIQSNRKVYSDYNQTVKSNSLDLDRNRKLTLAQRKENLLSSRKILKIWTCMECFLWLWNIHNYKNLITINRWWDFYFSKNNHNSKEFLLIQLHNFSLSFPCEIITFWGFSKQCIISLLKVECKRLFIVTFWRYNVDRIMGSGHLIFFVCYRRYHHTSILGKMIVMSQKGDSCYLASTKCYSLFFHKKQKTKQLRKEETNKSDCVDHHNWGILQ